MISATQFTRGASTFSQSFDLIMEQMRTRDGAKARPKGDVSKTCTTDLGHW